MTCISLISLIYGVKPYFCFTSYFCPASFCHCLHQVPLYCFQGSPITVSMHHYFVGGQYGTKCGLTSPAMVVTPCGYPRWTDFRPLRSTSGWGGRYSTCSPQPGSGEQLEVSVKHEGLKNNLQKVKGRQLIAVWKIMALHSLSSSAECQMSKFSVGEWTEYMLEALAVVCPTL